MTKTVGVLMMAYGGPDSLEDVQPFLADIRHGRPTPPELLEEITERYRAIGGRSPILEITGAQARGVEAALNADASDVTFKTLCRRCSRTASTRSWPSSWPRTSAA